MVEDAFLDVALAELGEVPAVGHSVVVELVEEGARVVALLAQPAQPVLADETVPARVVPLLGRERRRRRVGFDAEHFVEIDVADVVEEPRHSGRASDGSRY